MLKIFIFNLKRNTLPVLDNSTAHLTSKAKDKIKECEIVLLVILSGLAWRLQQLDICITKVFKECLINKYVGYWIDNNNIKVAKSVIIE